MTQLDFWSEELPANHSLLQDLGKDLKIQEAILLSPMLEFLTTLDPSGSFGKMCQVSLVAGGGRDFGSFLGALGELGYGWSYRVLDAQYFGVAQRRRRVFVVGCLGDWRPTAEVLFESESLRRDIKKGKSKGKDIAGYVKSGFGQYREDAIAGTLRASGGDLSGGSETFVTNDTVGTLLARDYKGVDSYNTDKMIVQKVYENHPSDSRVKEMGKTCQTVTSTWGSGGGNVPFVQNIAYEWHNQDSRIKPIKVAATLNCNAGGREGHLVQSVAYGFEPGITKREGNPNRFTKEISPTLRAEMGDNQVSIANSMAIRRLTPVECERLQGFPDNYTNIRENCPDGARYKALGNSMAVPVMRWIGERINSYETMRSSAVVQVETGVGLAEV